ncbi:MAG TPA: cobalamin-dependent protein [Anaeromyxobacteraceae bacterium]|nr:cobalamin-dependent protein [Anaeromyxobacteraceae bacterium]
MEALTELQHDFLQALVSLNGSAAQRFVRDRAAASSPLQALEELVTPALEELGAQWDRGEAALSQVYMGGRLCEQIVDALLPPPGDAPLRSDADRPRMAIAVISDRHMLGKRIVASVLRAAGWKLLDYGHGDADSLAARARADGLDVLLVSALMLPSALEVKRLTGLLSTTVPRVRVVVGGAPFVFDEQLWREVGADACGRNAADALAIVRRLSAEVAACAP